MKNSKMILLIISILLIINTVVFANESNDEIYHFKSIDEPSIISNEEILQSAGGNWEKVFFWKI